MKNFILFLLLFPILALAQIPQTMNYQGRLEDNSGNPVTDGNYSIIFTIYDDATNGNSLWTETRTVTTEDGFFTLTLGENTAIDIDTDQQIWLNVNIGGTDLTPRTKLSGSLSSLSTKTVENTATAGNSVVTSINSSTGEINAEKIADGSVSNTEYQFLDGATSTLVGVSDPQTLSSKTIDADNNTISNIDNSDIKAAASIDASKIADGSVSNSEFQLLSGVTSAVVGVSDTQTMTNKTLTDASSFMQDNSDNSKKIQFELSGISTSTTRTITVPDVNTTIVGTDATQTLTNKSIDAASNTITNIFPDQAGKSGKFLSTDGTTLSWEAAGGGGGSLPEVTELSLGTLITLTSTTYVNITDTQPTLAANATYLIKGILGAKKKGSSPTINIFLNYSGNTNLNYFKINSEYFSGNTGTKENYSLQADTEYLFEGLINTTSSGTFSIQAAKYSPSASNSEITTDTRILLIRVR
ncbi:MAG: hypothetical protein WC121_04360 [Candidatus Kapaibacterium sp.]